MRLLKIEMLVMKTPPAELKFLRSSVSCTHTTSGDSITIAPEVNSIQLLKMPKNIMVSKILTKKYSTENNN